ncbi:TelA-like protein SA1238 [[Ruminococcus] torques]|nr:TelA-like protein SA1238 [[Ruminococcus] torques]
MEKEGNEIEVLEKNQLIVGNDDSILLFGCEAQQQLREFSKAISNQLLNSNGDLEYLIHDLLKEIDDFQVSIEKKVGIFSGSNEKKRERLIKKYNDVLVYMDKMELALKLQEAQLIKDSKLFEELSRCIDETLSSLQTAISYGNDVVNQKPKGPISDDIKEWYERLSKRLEDLGISHTVALQTKAQMKLMLGNDAQLIDKIMGAVSGTIPIWRNQITLLLGIEKMNRNLEIQTKVAEITQKYITKEKNIGRKKRVDYTELCVEKLMNTNETLKKALDDLDSIEKKDGGIRLELSGSLR